MRVTGWEVGLLIAAVLLGSCRTRGTMDATSPPAPARRCAPAGTRVDSSFVAEQARGVLSRPGYTLRVDSFQPVRASGIEVGVLISLVSSEPPVVGGGGLVWVDVETGCPIVLRRYE